MTRKQFALVVKMKETFQDSQMHIIYIVLVQRY